MPPLNCALARLITPNPATEAELQSMRVAAWHKQGVLVVMPELMTDAWERQLLVGIGNRLYGRRTANTAANHGPA